MNSLAENERELLFQFLAGYWYDRAEEDEVIVAQYVADVSPEELVELVRVVRKFIDSPCPSAEKSAFIRSLVWRSLPENDEAPIDWLRTILAHLEALGGYDGLDQ
jgi:hypothetical protein